MSTIVVGISAHFHDAACCILRDGALIAAAQEERFSRVKHDPALPMRAFQYCLDEAGVAIDAIDEIDCIGYYENPTRKLERQLWMGLPELPMASWSTRHLYDASRPERDMRDMLGFEGPIRFFDHHLSHAASSYYFSDFDDAAILTVDAVGELATTTYGRARGGDIELFEEVEFPGSLGLFYSAITAYLGFEVNDGEYKVMGLAPYGRPRYVEELRKLVRLEDDGQFSLAMEYFDFLRGERMFSAALTELLGHPPREPESELTPFAMDLARSVQAVLEEVLLAKVGYLGQQVDSRNLCLAGGVALNCVAVRRLLRESRFVRVFVQPAAGDAGACLGAAALAHRHVTGHPCRRGLAHLYWGPSFSADEIVEMLSDSTIRIEDFRGRGADMIAAVAGRLARRGHRLVSWADGVRAASPGRAFDPGRSAAAPHARSGQRTGQEARGVPPVRARGPAGARGRALRRPRPGAVHDPDVPRGVRARSAGRDPRRWLRAPADGRPGHGAPLSRAADGVHEPDRLSGAAQHLVQPARGAHRMRTAGRAAVRHPQRPRCARHGGSGDRAQQRWPGASRTRARHAPRRCSSSTTASTPRPTACWPAALWPGARPRARVRAAGARARRTVRPADRAHAALPRRGPAAGANAQRG